MKVYSDSIFKIGKSHKVCEDYARNGTSGAWTYAILSDGCSGGEHSDIAARLLVQCGIKNLSQVNEISDPKFFFESVILRSKFIAKSMGLGNTSLLGTLMIIASSDNEDFAHVLIAGDGHLSMLFDNDILVAESVYNKSKPYYPIYGETSLFEKESSASGQEFSFSWNKVVSEIKEEQHGYITHIKVPKKKLRWILVSSDGASTFVSNDPKTAEINGAESKIEVLSAIKRTQGAFIARRVEAALKRDLKDYSHLDDLSVAGLSFMEDNQ